MRRKTKILLVCGLLVLLLLTVFIPASAFEGRSGGDVVIPADEVIEDDLYVTADTFVLHGTVNGDLIVAGRDLTINGRVDGDLIAVGQNVLVNGEVTGSVRTASFASLFGEQASTGGDMIAAGYSLETREGSVIGQDLLFAGAQLLLSGEVRRHAHVSARAFELHGVVGGSLSAGVGEAGAGSTGAQFTRYLPQPVFTVPSLNPGLTIGQQARIEGDLSYRQSKELAFPAGAVAGAVTRRGPAASQATTSGRFLTWGVDVLRTSITLILIGLFMLWLFPNFLRELGLKLRSSVLASLGWGVVAYPAVFILLLFILLVIIVGALVFGLITLSGLASAVAGVGILSLITVILGFVLITSFLAKVVFGQALGGWLLARTNSPLAEHRFWPMVIGVLITVVVIALLSLPPIPSFLGWLLNFAVILFGLGALWLWGGERLDRVAE